MLTIRTKKSHRHGNTVTGWAFAGSGKENFRPEPLFVFVIDLRLYTAIFDIDIADEQRHLVVFV